MPIPVCASCRRTMRSSGVGVIVQFNARATGGAYQQFNADAFKCPSCGTEVIARYGQHPGWEHHQGQEKRDKNPYVIIEEGL